MQSSCVPACGLISGLISGVISGLISGLISGQIGGLQLVSILGSSPAVKILCRQECFQKAQQGRPGLLFCGQTACALVWAVPANNLSLQRPNYYSKGGLNGLLSLWSCAYCEFVCNLWSAQPFVACGRMYCNVCKCACECALLSFVRSPSLTSLVKPKVFCTCAQQHPICARLCRACGSLSFAAQCHAQRLLPAPASCCSVLHTTSALCSLLAVLRCPFGAPPCLPKGIPASQPEGNPGLLGQASQFVRHIAVLHGSCPAHPAPAQLPACAPSPCRAPPWHAYLCCIQRSVCRTFMHVDHTLC